MKKFTIIVAICAALVFPPCATSAPEPQDVSLVQLIATPAKYHGKLVRVIAFLSFKFESQVLYLHQEDFKRLIFRNGIWISVPEGMKVDAENMNGKYVLAVGRYDMNFRGHKSVYSGALTKVERLMPWVSRSEP